MSYKENKTNDLIRFTSAGYTGVRGYEPIKTNEEQIKELFFIRNHLRDEFDEGYCKGVRDALRIHGIEYEWLKDDAE